ncbi:MAG: DUF2130 domain-containing protein [Campylobacterota bacterium]|nr:DUF2130 domain-containing protein [Campylobacterota bacterium]
MSTTIECPSCGVEIDVNERLSHQLEDEIKQRNAIASKKLQDEIEAKRDEYKEALGRLKVEREEFDTQLAKATEAKVKEESARLQSEIKRELLAEQKESMALLQKELDEKSAQVQELHKSKIQIAKLQREKSEIEDKIKADIEQEFNAKLKLEQDRADLEQIKTKEKLKQEFQEERAKEKLEQERAKELLKKELAAEQNESLQLLQKELKAKSEQVKELNNATIEIAKLKREKDELTSKAKAEAQVELSRLLQEEKAKIAKSISEQNELKLKAKDEQIEQMRRDIDNARRKAEQGSMQVQGEALELTIESWLESQFPFDSIDEVKKGAFGADCVQTVNTREIPNCGVICYESKNTKAWSDSWIAKLKQDMLSVNADIGVLVTSVYPKEMRRMGFVDGIWVCSLDEFKGSVSLLRESLIRLHQGIRRDENRADKMSLLYDYMTGNEFSMQMKAIVDGFIKMQDELAKEKRSLMASWKRREKTIDGVLANTTEMYGALQGIAGSSAIVHIDALELPEEIE